VLRRTTGLVDQARDLEASGAMTWSTYFRSIVPIGALFSLSLVLSNWV